ncbi:MAG: hypothetical protein ACRD3O_22895, partial [Terriglobia bacterium]
NAFEGPEPQAGEYRWATVTDSGDYDLVAHLAPDYFASMMTPEAAPTAPAGLLQIRSAGSAGPVGQRYALPQL